jgi:hypothetical protein
MKYISLGAVEHAPNQGYCVQVAYGTHSWLKSVINDTLAGIIGGLQTRSVALNYKRLRATDPGSFAPPVKTVLSSEETPTRGRKFFITL